jgi:two-component system, OmpR family, alkaline phosphatase synthesis response regulator PhoP
MAKTYKVYVVDDDRNIVESLSIVLKSSGYEVGCQYDEANLVANVTKFKPDVVILDVMFPEDDSAGFELARKLKNDAATAGIPVLMLSAINEKGIFTGKFSNKDRDATWLPVQEFVEKPINPKLLLAKIEALRDRK